MSANDKIAEPVAAMRREMVYAMRQMLGAGYVSDYYVQMAEDFAGVAEQFMAEAYGIGQDNPTKLHDMGAGL